MLNLIGSMSAKTGVAPVAKNAADRREKRKGREDDFIARTDLQGVQCEQYRVGAGTAADAMLGIAILGDFVLESGDFRTEDNLAATQDPKHGGFDLRLDLAILRAEVA